MMSPVVSYHYPCPDGVFAALAAHLKFVETGAHPVWIPNTVYSPRQLQDLHLQVKYASDGATIVMLPISNLVGVLQATQTLYMLDYVGPAGFARAAAEAGTRYDMTL